MIVSFANRDTAEFASSGRTARGWQHAASVALRKIDALRAAVRLEDRIEALKGNRAGQHSIRINDQWRLCFRWTDNGAEDVEIVDCHKG